jgi:asparagine synthase (glutamine-hydrolysing)
MCGIAGLICFHTACNEEDHLSLVRTMCAIQAHRGPDDTGVVSLGSVCLGAVRLSIIDLTEAGHMPMTDESGRWCIVYNGEVYNFKELREELSRCGHTFRSQTDTEVVLHAFSEWGEQCLQRFVGMFAFAIYDRQTETVTLVRDRLGIKPLYYMQCGNHLLLSSEIKALVQMNSHLNINKRRLIEWSLYRNVDVFSPETLFEDTYSVLPGQVVRIKRRDISSRDYYSPLTHVNKGQYHKFADERPEAVIAEIETAIHQSVSDRLVSDVPIGTLCSGGLDSSLITAVAAQHCTQLTAFHVSVAGYLALDEKTYAEELTKNLGIPLISCELTGETYRRELVRTIYLSDFPLSHPNSVAYFLISQVARKHGVIVLLSGEGADELFGGYSWRYRRYRHILRAQRLLHLLPRKIRRGIEFAGYVCAGLPMTNLRFEELLPQTISLIDGYSRKEWRLQCEEAYEFVSDPLDRAVLGALLGDLREFLTPLLRRLDRMSMGASTECRVPFLDHRLVNKAINLPLPYRLHRRADKWILKQIALRYLHTKIITRKKMGFVLPMHDYMAPLAQVELFNNGFCHQFLGLSPRTIKEFVVSWHKNPVAFHSLVSLEIWGRLFFLQESLEQVNEVVAKLEYKHAHLS